MSATAAVTSPKKDKKHSLDSSEQSANKKQKGEDGEPVVDKNGTEHQGPWSNPKFPQKDHVYYSSPTGVKMAYSIVYVSDPAVSIKFYQELLGFEIKCSWGPHWTELATGNTSLALHWIEPGKQEGDASSSSNVKRDPKTHRAGEGAPSFFVDNIEEFHEKAKKTKGLTVVSEPTKQFWGGTQATYSDPDGCPLTFTQAPQGPPADSTK